jgi:molybdopterin/thiamine biosynthesis adenylyltransferase
VTGHSRRGLFRAAALAARDAALAAQGIAGEPPPSALSPEELARYSRQLALPEWGEAQQVALRDASVLVIGAGGLGSPVALYLAGAGVGRLGIVDSDEVEVSNLHRQPLHFTPDLGSPKVQSAVAKLRFLNPDVQVEPYQARVTSTNVDALIADVDLVVDCSDTFATRYLVNDACCMAGVPLVEGGAVGMSGLVLSVRPGQSACYRCVFPAPPAAEATCAQAGILGPVAGVIGSLQALEAVKLLAGLDGALLDAMLQVDLAEASFVRVGTRRREGCPACG